MFNIIWLPVVRENIPVLWTFISLIAYTIILLNHIEQQHLLYWPVIKVSHCVITSFFLYSSGAVVRKQELVFYPRGNLDSL